MRFRLWEIIDKQHQLIARTPSLSHVSTGYVLVYKYESQTDSEPQYLNTGLFYFHFKNSITPPSPSTCPHTYTSLPISPSLFTPPLSTSVTVLASKL